MISLSGAVNLITLVVVGGMIFALLHWLIDYVGLPDPWRRVARVILAVLAVAVLIGVLLSLVTEKPLFRP